MKTYTCYFDGSCEPKNPDGSMGCGVYIIGEGQEYFTTKNFPAKKGNTNNIAEYIALIMVLKIMKSKVDCKIEIFGDSKLVVNQILENWKIKGGAYKPYALQAKPLFKELSKNNILTIQWIPREQNTKADEQSKKHLIVL